MFSRIGAFFTAGEIDTPGGRALVEERHSALRRQVPVIYLLAAVNLFCLQVASGEGLSVGLNVPTAVAVCAVLRMVQWLRSDQPASHSVMLRRMEQTILLALVTCVAVFAWCWHVLSSHADASPMAVMLFGALTAVGVSYGLSPLPAAARIPLLVIAFPLAAVALFSNDAQFIGVALSVSFVAAMLLRLLEVSNSHFTAVVQSRSIIARRQELADSARQEAIVAATTDFLTGLPNRRAFVAALEEHFRQSPEGPAFAVGILDLDRFKAINDTFGHASGDSLLVTVAKRLRSAAGKDILVARLGGDEFGLLLPGVRTAAKAERAAYRILATVNRPARIEGRSFGISLCCGLAIAGLRKERTPSRALADADLALYDAKDRGGGLAVFQPAMEAPRRRRLQVERALQAPRVHEGMTLVYQPIFDLGSGKVIANEALARWTDEELGVVSPGEFVPIAEQLNLIGGLTSHLMVTAFADAAAWPEPVRLSFNLSALDLCTAGSADLLLKALQKAQLATSRLQVEVTETALLRDFNRAKENLAALSAAGVTVVLDDFGAGYASIGYLKELRFDQIKLDGGLLAAAVDNADGQRLLGAVIGLCQALGVETVAEHVEREEQLQLLIRLGCSAGQGFWLAKPMPAGELHDFCSSASAVTGSTMRPRRAA